MKKNHTFEIRLTFPPDRSGAENLLAVILERLRLKKENLVFYKDKYKSQILYYTSSKTRAKGVQKRLANLRLKMVRVQLKHLTSGDWQDVWKKDFKPFFLTPSIEIIPDWLKKKHRPRKKRAIYLDTSLAFGTGLHETTRFMAMLIEGCEGRFKRFLDVGTGTGILSLTALHSGAKEITAVDIEPDAVETAKKNFQRNERDIHLYTWKCGNIFKMKLSHTYDFVAANLVTQDLMDEARKLVALVKKEGYLAVSGVSRERVKELKKKFNVFPLQCVKQIIGRDWAALLYCQRRRNI